MKKYSVITCLLSVILLLAGCTGTTTEFPEGAVENANFRLLLSDDASNKTAIGDFESVVIEVLGIGFRKSGGPELLINTTQTDELSGLEEGLRYDLTNYLDLEAVLLWEGNLDPGEYKGVVLYLADDVTGTLAPAAEGDEASEVNIKIPSDRLKVDIPFTVEAADDTSINYVFDITVFEDIDVVQAGKSGKYILKPVVKESGPDQAFLIHGAEEDEDDIEFKGKISGVTVVEDTVTLGVEVGDVTYEVIVDENTEVNGVEGEFTDEHVDLTVEVEGVLQEGDVVLASKIELNEEE